MAEHVAIQRHPQPQDEPPARHCQDKADCAPKDTALPDVITARARHDRDQGGVDDHFEEDEQGTDDQGRDQASSKIVHLAETVQPQRDQVDREQRVDERVEDRPRTDQAGRLTNEQVGHDTLLLWQCERAPRLSYLITR